MVPAEVEPMSKLATMVVVTTAAGEKLGSVRYVTADNWFGIGLENEGSRCDEWPASQVRPATTADRQAAISRTLARVA